MHDNKHNFIFIFKDGINKRYVAIEVEFDSQEKLEKDKCSGIALHATKELLKAWKEE